MSLKKSLEGRLTKKELSLLKKSFDVIGSREKAAAIVEIPEELKPKKGIIAETIMESHKNVKSVLIKKSERKGEFRIRDYEIIGDKDTRVIHKEFGCSISVNPQDVYFSSRESTERLRVAEQVRKGETVMVFFSGAGPMCAVMAKKAKPKYIIGIEINPKGFFHACETARLNKIENIFMPVLGDVKTQAPLFYGRCDRVAMPLPAKSRLFLSYAMKCLKPRGYIHFYAFSGEDDLYGQWEKAILKAAERLNKTVKFTGRTKVHAYAPGVWKVCLDVRVEDDRN